MKWHAKTSPARSLPISPWSDRVRLTRIVFAVCFALPLPAFALDVAAISRGLVEAGPWGKRPELLPYLLAWFGIVLLLAVLLKIVHREYDLWRGRQQAWQASQQDTEKWILEIGALLDVPPPPKLKHGAPSGLWRQYRHHVRLALNEQLRHGRDAMAELAEQRASGSAR
jgi:hypothetical protein